MSYLDSGSPQGGVISPILANAYLHYVLDEWMSFLSVSVGVRNVILPGHMKDLMNRVTEAKKAAEANLIARREETAAMRSQANTAKLLADNPTLMRLRELEILEKVACNGKLNVVLGEQGLADRVVNLL